MSKKLSWMPMRELQDLGQDRVHRSSLGFAGGVVVRDSKAAASGAGTAGRSILPLALMAGANGDERGGDHVVGQFLHQETTQFRRSTRSDRGRYRPLGGLAARPVLARHDRRVAEVRMPLEHDFDFARFQREALHFHLLIVPAKNTTLPVPAPPDQVAGLVKSAAAASSNGSAMNLSAVNSGRFR